MAGCCASIWFRCPHRMSFLARFVLTHSKNNRPELLCSGPSCTCASACALIWFGAVDRSGTVGLHRPKINDPQFAALPPPEASTVYKQALQRISRYLEEMEAPRALIDSMVATSSSEIRWVDAFNEKLQHPPSFVEWTDASCGGITSREEDVFGQLNYREAMNGEILTEQERRLKDALGTKIFKRNGCMIELARRRQDALSPP